MLFAHIVMTLFLMRLWHERQNENLTLLVYDIYGFSLCRVSPCWCDVMLYLGIPLKRSKTAYTGFS